MIPRKLDILRSLTPSKAMKPFKGLALIRDTIRELYLAVKKMNQGYQSVATGKHS